jgi:hypothetical protein
MLRPSKVKLMVAISAKEIMNASNIFTRVPTHTS